MPEVTDQLSEAVSRYETYFKSPFPTSVIRAVSEGKASPQEVSQRAEAAVASGRADQEWEQMIPPEGSVEHRLYYLPRSRQLAGKKH